MTPVVERVRTTRTFQALRRPDGRARRGSVRVAWVAGDESVKPQVAYGISKRCGSAVARNRLRRRLREIVRQSSELHPGAYLISTDPAAQEQDFTQLRSDVEAALAAASRSVGSVR
jgi:ribonuclease P protein component